MESVFDALPDEMVVEILYKLLDDSKSFVNFTSTCKRFMQLSHTITTSPQWTNKRSLRIIIYASRLPDNLPFKFRRFSTLKLYSVPEIDYSYSLIHLKSIDKLNSINGSKSDYNNDNFNSICKVAIFGPLVDARRIVKELEPFKNLKYLTLQSDIYAFRHFEYRFSNDEDGYSQSTKATSLNLARLTIAGWRGTDDEYFASLADYFSPVELKIRAHEFHHPMATDEEVASWNLEESIEPLEDFLTVRAILIYLRKHRSRIRRLIFSNCEVDRLTLKHILDSKDSEHVKIVLTTDCSSDLGLDDNIDDIDEGEFVKTYGPRVDYIIK